MALVARALADRVPATCAASDAVGNLVYLVDGAAGVFTVAKVDITDAAKLPGVGTIVSKASATTCLVQTGGQVKGVYTTLTPGKVHYVGFDANPTSVVPAPSGPNPKVYVQPVGVAVDVDVLLLQPFPQAIARVL